MVRSCCVCKLCKQQCDISLHRFPKNEKLRSKWINAIPVKNININSTPLVCSRHFEQNCFYIDASKPQLKKNSVPTIFDEYEPLKRAKKCEESCNERIIDDEETLTSDEIPIMDESLDSKEVVRTSFENVLYETTLITTAPPPPPALSPLSVISGAPSTSTFVPPGTSQDPLSMISVSYDQEQLETDSQFEDITIKEEPLDHAYLSEETEEDLKESKETVTRIHETFPQSVASFVSIHVKEEARELEQNDDEEDPLQTKEQQEITIKTIEEAKIDSKFLELWNTKISVPNEFWTVNKIDDGIKRMIVLLKLYVPSSGIPVIEKQMIMQQDMQFKWYIFSKEIGTMSFFSQEVFDNLMKHLDSMKVCYGGPQPPKIQNPVFPTASNFFFDSSLNVLRHKSCKYVINDSSKKSCKMCSETIPSTDNNPEDGNASKVWRAKYKASQKEVKDLKQTIDWLLKKGDEVKTPTNHTLVD